MALNRHTRDSRGAVLVHVAVMLLGLMAFSALAFDYGVMFVSRRQIQNAADAAALAAASSHAFIPGSSQTLARNSAIAAARRNLVWGEAPDMLSADVEFSPPCPPGAPGVPGTCVHLHAYRTSYERGGGRPLPTYFANIFGVGEQGTRATATAQMIAGSGTGDCVKPWAVADQWLDNPLGLAGTFSRYVLSGGVLGSLVPNPDTYIPPTASSLGSGFSLPADYGRQLTLTLGAAGSSIVPGWFNPVEIDVAAAAGIAGYRQAIRACLSVPVGGGTTLGAQAGVTAPETAVEVSALIAQDSSASWSTGANGGRGGPVGGCMSAGTCTRSPRLVAVPVFNVDLFDQARAAGGLNISITHVIGLWIERLQGNDIVGYVSHFPTVSVTGGLLGPGGGSSFARRVILVR